MFDFISDLGDFFYVTVFFFAFLQVCLNFFLLLFIILIRSLFLFLDTASFKSNAERMHGSGIRGGNCCTRGEGTWYTKN